MANKFRFYFDKDYEFLLKEELERNNEYMAKRYAKSRLRMYANLFTRDLRKVLLTDSSHCCFCNDTEKLQLDHIIPIDKGGKNVAENIQILCRDCNRQKSSKII